jgi:SPP1 family predicted phage head-tail adaptor
VIRAGGMRHRVTLQVMSEAQDSVGQPIQSWADVGTFWANVREMSGREAVTARQLNAELTHAVTMRGVGATIKAATHRLVASGRVLGIESVIDAEGNGSRLELLCKAIIR